MGALVGPDEDSLVSIEHPSLGIPRPILEALPSELSITQLFEIQAAVVSHLVAHPTRDAVICAPTGSGKTLSYAIPVLSRLCSRVVPKLRAVVVVPTRDLASQVHQVLRKLSVNTDLTVTLADGTSSVKREAQAIMGGDILVATPGRLVEHTKNTPSFSLSAVEFLVLDESDRLLHDTFYSWVEVVVPACGKVPDHLLGVPPIGLASIALHPVPSPSLTRRRPQMILASATQTKDPKRLTLLDLQRPAEFSLSSRRTADPASSTAEVPASATEREFEDVPTHSVPTSLSENAYVVAGASEKPAALAKLLSFANAKPSDTGVIEPLPDTKSMLIFTKSVEAAHRLARLLECLSFQLASAPLSIMEMTGDLSMDRRTQVLGAARTSNTVIVCSDVLARGMDISGIDAVVNYDAPVHVSTYVHRVGRTARASREGVAVSLVVANQARHFKSMVRAIDRGESKIRIRSVKSPENEYSGLLPGIERGLASLKRVLRREQLGLVRRDLPLPNYVLRDLSQETKRLSIVQSDENDDVEGATDPAEDDFRHLLRAQIARNFLSASQ